MLVVTRGYLVFSVFQTCHSLRHWRHWRNWGALAVSLAARYGMPWTRIADMWHVGNSANTVDWFFSLCFVFWVSEWVSSCKCLWFLARGWCLIPTWKQHSTLDRHLIDTHCSQPFHRGFEEYREMLKEGGCSIGLIFGWEKCGGHHGINHSSSVKYFWVAVDFTKPMLRCLSFLHRVEKVGEVGQILTNPID